jgi:hypothetical protein
MDEFVSAAKQMPEYQWHSSFAAERMQGLVPKWQEDLGLRLEQKYRPFWHLLVNRARSVALPDEATGRLVLTGQTPELSLEITKLQKGTGGRRLLHGPETYLVREADLGDVGRKVLEWIVPQDPLFAPVERFAAQNEPLSTLFNRLCEMGQASSSYRQDLADKMRITLDLRGKTVLGCLTVLARTAGGQALVLGSGQEPTPVEKVGRGRAIDVESLWREQAESPATQPVGEHADPVEILYKAVESRAESIRKDRPVVILQLPVATE